jgi:hypothetical protein
LEDKNVQLREKAVNNGEIFLIRITQGMILDMEKKKNQINYCDQSVKTIKQSWKHKY